MSNFSGWDSNIILCRAAYFYNVNLALFKVIRDVYNWLEMKSRPPH
jgi:hypothetical protein